MADLGPHQLKAIREIRNGCILQGGVGSGKTRTALVYYYTHVADGRLKINGQGDWKEAQNPTDLYVITTARKRDHLDWEAEAVKIGLSTDEDVAYPGIKMVVDSWNNLYKYEGVSNAFFIFDEQRLVGSGAWVKAFLKVAKSNQWILLSATPGDTWMDYIPVFIANGFYKNRYEFTRRHVVYSPYTSFPKIDRYVETAQLERLRKSILVDMPYERHTTRHIIHVPVKYDQEQYDLVTKKRWNVFEDEPLKNVSQLFVAMRRVVNNDVSRLGAIMEIYEKHPKLIVFYSFDYELATLRTLANLGITVAEYNGHKHQDVPTGDKWIYLVQYMSGAEAWNCVETNAIAFWSLQYSYKIWEQTQGRIDRLNTPFTDLYYYVLVSQSPIDTGILGAIRTKRDFNESQFAAKMQVSVKNPEK